MLLKIIAFISAAVPIFLFVRSMFFRRPTRTSGRWKEFKQQADRAVLIFLILVGVLVASALVKLIWTWLAPT
jgi:NADH:ubiquinone oxidoreductase subunit 6 (subunit J)